MNNVKSKLLDILENNGISTDEKNINYLELLDSLQYISFICEVEEVLNITIPESVLDMNKYKSFEAFSAEIFRLIKSEGVK